MKYWHPETQQKFATKQQAQSALKILSPVLVEPAIPARPATSSAQIATLSDTPTLTDDVWSYTWTVTDIAVTVEMVKAEARSRIIAIVDEDKQRNLTARATVLSEKGRANWTSDELAEWNAGMAVWEAILAIRAASDVIEAMEPIPSDFTADTYWPD